MNLSRFFSENKKVAIAFSGGVDSSYLLYEGIKSGAEVKAYYVKSQFQPIFEFKDAKKIAELLKADLEIIETDVLKCEDIVANKKNRCYYCKKEIFKLISKNAQKDGYSVILDGTNASDDISDRPGMKALTELSVLSPLRMCGLTKEQIRNNSKAAGLFTWNKPAYACLATRIKTDERITADKLIRTEKTENFMFSMGFRDFRIRTVGNSAKIQITDNQFGMLTENRLIIYEELKKYYDSVLLDMEAR